LKGGKEDSNNNIYRAERSTTMEKSTGAFGIGGLYMWRRGGKNVEDSGGEKEIAPSGGVMTCHRKKGFGLQLQGKSSQIREKAPFFKRLSARWEKILAIAGIGRKTSRLKGKDTSNDQEKSSTPLYEKKGDLALCG